MALSDEAQRFKDLLSCCTYNGAQHTHVLIEEVGSSAALRKVTLIANSGDWFAFNPDKGRGRCSKMSPLLAVGSAHAHHRACDCVTIINRGGELTVLYFDLKSGNPIGYAGQFGSTRQFVRYALGLLEEFHAVKFQSVIERYVVLFGGKSVLLNKTPTIPKIERLGETRPNKPHKREVNNAARLYLKEFLS